MQSNIDKFNRILDNFDVSLFLYDQELLTHIKLNRSDIVDVEIIKSIAPKGEIYTWYIHVHNYGRIRITRSKKSRYILLYSENCLDCGKVISTHRRLSRLFKLGNSDISSKDRHSGRCDTCKGRYNALNGQQASKRTCLEKYGTEYSFQSENNRVKSEKTLIEKYGENYRKVICYDMWKKYYKRTGYKHNMHNPESLSKMTKSWKDTMDKIPTKVKREWNERRMNSYDDPMSPGLFGNKLNNSKSKISIEMFKSLELMINDKVFLYNNNEQRIGNRYVDCVIDDVCIIEFFGSYWHADPMIYDSDDIIRSTSDGNLTSAQDIWNKDKNRFGEILENTELPILVVWENDYLYNKANMLNMIFDEVMKIKNGDENVECIRTIYRS